MKVLSKSSRVCREEHLERLGVTAEEIQRVPQIGRIFRKIGGIRKVVEYLRGSSDPDARKILEKIDELGQRALSLVPIEAYCLAAKVPTERAFGVVASAVLWQTTQESGLLAAATHPSVVARTIERALEAPRVVKLPDGSHKVIVPPDGEADRKMLHQHAGFLPQPRNTTVQFFGGQAIDARSQTNNIAVLPAVEDSVRRMSDRFNEKMLTAGPVADAVDVVEETNEED